LAGGAHARNGELDEPALPEIDFDAAGIDSGLRPENLSPEDYARLSMNSI
jgi:hypothetical protein